MRQPNRASAFDFLRVAFAAVVLAAHLMILTEAVVPGWFRSGLLTLGYYCVQGFFLISGYLVAGSLARSDSWRLYAEKRLRRVYPAYTTVILSAVVLGLVMSPEARSDLGAVARYAFWNLVFLNFLEPNIPGLFEDNLFTEVNGALWTVKIEVMFYIVLPVLAIVLKRTGGLYWAAVALVYVGAVLWQELVPTLAAPYVGEQLAAQLSRQLPGQMDIFIVGMVLAGKKPIREENALRAGLASAVLLAATIALPVLKPLEAVAVGGLVVSLGRYWRIPFDAGRFGDLSYGVYALHFPIIQTLIAMGVFAVSYPFGVLAALVLTFTAAALMWRYIERPALRMDSAYRREAVSAERTPAPSS
ncbi:MAG: acyltransferase [Pseudomonadota bacterium]